MTDQADRLSTPLIFEVDSTPRISSVEGGYDVVTASQRLFVAAGQAAIFRFPEVEGEGVTYSFFGPDMDSARARQVLGI